MLSGLELILFLLISSAGILKITVRAECPDITGVKDGTVMYLQANYAAKHSTGTIAFVICNFGHLNSYPLSVVCQNDGKWNDKIGDCIETSKVGSASCDPQETKADVTYIPPESSKKYPSGTFALLHCALGEIPSGAISALCFDGKWSTKLGTCQKLFGDFQSNSPAPTPVLATGPGTTEPSQPVKCPKIADDLNGHIKYEQINESEEYLPGTHVSVKCYDGYSSTYPLTARCMHNGTWNSALGGCIKIEDVITAFCAPLKVNDGRVTYQSATVDGSKNQYRTGTIAKLHCAPGKLPFGSIAALCYAGKWSMELGACISAYSEAEEGKLGLEGHPDTRCPDFPDEPRPSLGPGLAHRNKTNGETEQTVNRESDDPHLNPDRPKPKLRQRNRSAGKDVAAKRNKSSLNWHSNSPYPYPNIPNEMKPRAEHRNGAQQGKNKKIAGMDRAVSPVGRNKGITKISAQYYPDLRDGPRLRRQHEGRDTEGTGYLGAGSPRERNGGKSGYQKTGFSSGMNAPFKNVGPSKAIKREAVKVSTGADRDVTTNAEATESASSRENSKARVHQAAGPPAAATVHDSGFQAIGSSAGNNATVHQAAGPPVPS